MSSDTYKPVRVDSKKAIAEARKRPGFTEAWDALEEEYSALSALIKARQKAGLTQEELAEKMGTTKSAVSRLEASLRNEKHSPSFATLKRYANACGKKIMVRLV